jgi:predicted dehydrogenase
LREIEELSVKHVGVDIIGCGARALYFMRCIDALDERIEMAALCDPAPQSIAVAKAAFAFQPTVYLEKCCHDIDLVNWMVDSLPLQVIYWKR